MLRQTTGWLVGGFWRALVLSVLVSFVAVSWALKLPWVASVEQRLEPQIAQLRAYWPAELPLGQWLDTVLAGYEVRSAGTSGVPAPAPAPAATADFAQCRHFFPDGVPPVVHRVKAVSYALCFDAFAILYNADTKTPVYVVERLNRNSLTAAKAISRSDRFYPEARLPSSARALLEDYRGSGFSRGHMAPAADMPSNAAMAQSFSLANMVPQNQSHNSGPWSKIEQDTRQYVMRARGDVFVFTGPAYEANRVARIGPSGVAVPSHLFKLVYDANTQRSWAHWQQNAAGEQSMRPISYRELSQRMQIDFLPNR
ncbi:DNA/RNA non-specific endonuclease [Lampropedia aestuarii]|uniref:DNA/RNA non-specific endonuclease n=1 Tax=Lampropedia aestuarii TaxID=2562762 RepID=A0A4S5BQ25_9BURK|nr:DNA/RNA non-specific endonuclease [Lampropedia aestuarii]THJ34570.1 DNA/RNA non-specific endonuclease [Lampropedia aestuarii]